MFVVSDELCDDVLDAQRLLSAVLSSEERMAVLQGLAWTACGPVGDELASRAGEKESDKVSSKEAPGCAEVKDE